MSLRNKVALVTGAGQGIGRAIALTMASQGAQVVINDINENAEKVANEIRSQKGTAFPIIADVSSSQAVNAMVDNIISRCNHIDILVNNAGITRDQLLIRMSDGEWDSVLSINLKSVFLCSRAVFRHMAKQKYGRIINLASVVGLIGNPGQTNYAASKAGIVGFTRALAREGATRNITANAVAPGFIETDMTVMLSQDQKNLLLKTIPLGRMGSPQDVANSVSFLASEAAAYITGQVLAIDGGMTMS
jgi:3-oxoacyl-[acyl-carrier protein] reductase